MSKSRAWRDKSKDIGKKRVVQKIPRQRLAIYNKRQKNKTRPQKINEENHANKSVENAREKNRPAKETKQFWSKIWEQKEHNK